MKADELVPLLLKACPSATEAWEDHLKFWSSEARDDFLDMAVFAHHVVNAFNQGRTEEFPAFFELLERMLVEGDQQVIDLAIAGLIEDIQNIASHRQFGYRVFEKWLGPTSRRGWAEIEVAWEGKSSLADVVRAESKRET